MNENKCQCGCSKKDEFLEDLLARNTREKDNLIQILNEVQEHYGYIPKHAQMEIAEHLGLSMAEVYGVITFYARFTLKPKGKYNIAVCLGTAKNACWQCVSDGDNRLVLKEGTQLEGVQHYGCGTVCKSFAGNNRGVWVSGHIQHGSREPVYLQCVSPSAC